MSQFVDQLLLQLSQTAQLKQLLTSMDTADHSNMLFLLNAMYNLEFATIPDVQDIVIVVRRVEAQRLLLSSHQTQGTWTQTIPSYTRTDVAYESSDKLEPIWLDLAAEVGLTLSLQVDSGEVESVLTRSIHDFKTLDEFKARFSPLDMTGFLAEHHITTIEQLQEFQYLLTEVHLKQLPPSDQLNKVELTLSLAILIRDTIDITATLRDSKLVRALTNRILTFNKEVTGGEVLAPYAPVILFPKIAPGGSTPFSESDLQAFFKQEGILALFVTPS